MEEIFYGGCQPSKIDGTEHVITPDSKLEFPEEFSWRNLLPPVINQGKAFTCVCWTLTCILDYLLNEENDTPTVCNNFPVDDLYEQRSNKPGNGMSIKEGLHILRHKGLQGSKILGYAKINSTEALKQSLIMFGPCACGFPCYIQKGTDDFWKKGGKFIGGHCVTITGYNKRGFEIRNSWGDKWADNGYITIPYNEFEQFAFETWTITI